jgi:hypothetical protein
MISLTISASYNCANVAGLIIPNDIHDVSREEKFVSALLAL